jgi:hypothetical protein
MSVEPKTKKKKKKNKMWLQNICDTVGSVFYSRFVEADESSNESKSPSSAMNPQFVIGFLSLLLGAAESL